MATKFQTRGVALSDDQVKRLDTAADQLQKLTGENVSRARVVRALIDLKLGEVISFVQAGGRVPL